MTSALSVSERVKDSISVFLLRFQVDLYSATKKTLKGGFESLCTFAVNVFRKEKKALEPVVRPDRDANDGPHCLQNLNVPGNLKSKLFNKASTWWMIIAVKNWDGVTDLRQAARCPVCPGSRGRGPGPAAATVTVTAATIARIACRT
jgi:hypothetical protein